MPLKLVLCFYFIHSGIYGHYLDDKKIGEETISTEITPTNSTSAESTPTTIIATEFTTTRNITGNFIFIHL